MMHGGMLSIFPDWGTPLRDATNQAVNALVTMAGDRLEAASNGLLAVLVALEQLLQALPPGGLVLATAALGWASSRRLGFALASAAAVWLIGALGQWDQAMQTLALVREKQRRHADAVLLSRRADRLLTYQ